MFNTIITLIKGTEARADEALRDAQAIPLIEQKIREAETNLRHAKVTLASLIQRLRSEEKQKKNLDHKIQDLIGRATEAIENNREDLAQDAAEAIATMENEQKLRSATIERLQSKVERLRNTVEAEQRRIVDLRQGAISARAIRQEQKAQRQMSRGVAARSAAEEAEELITKVLGQENSECEQREILREIEEGISKDGLADRMADAGFGPATRSTATTVMQRLKNASKPTET